MVDILSAKQLIEPQIYGIQGLSGTGVNIGAKSIIIYIKDYSTEVEVRNRVGNNPYGFDLQFVYTGNITVFQ